MLLCCSTAALDIELSHGTMLRLAIITFARDLGHVMVSSICPVCAVAHWDVRVEHCRPFASYQLVDISGVVLKLKCPSCAVNGVESLNSILHCVEMVILSHRF
jgi:hypothetical protein